MSLVNRQHFCSFVCPIGPYLTLSGLLLVQKKIIGHFCRQSAKMVPPLADKIIKILDDSKRMFFVGERKWNLQR